MRNVGFDALPDDGPEKNVLAVCVASIKFTAPVDKELLNTVPSPEIEFTALLPVRTLTPPTCRPVQFREVVPVGNTHALVPDLFCSTRSFVDPCPVNMPPLAVDAATTPLPLVSEGIVPLNSAVPLNVSAPLNVLFPLFRGTVAPLAPVLLNAAVPNAEPLDFVQVMAVVPEVVQSPDRSALVTLVVPENFVKFPEAGDPVVVTLPAPAGVAQVPSPRQKVELFADVPLLSLFTDKFPLVILAAFVVSVVAEVANADPLVLVQVIAPVL